MGFRGWRPTNSAALWELGVLVVVFAAAGSGTLDARESLAHRVSTSLTAGTALLALVLVFALIVQPRKG